MTGTVTSMLGHGEQYRSLVATLTEQHAAALERAARIERALAALLIDPPDETCETEVHTPSPAA